MSNLQDTVPEHLKGMYKELKSVDGKVVGYVCVECGRLSTAPHKPDCSVGGSHA